MTSIFIKHWLRGPYTLVHSDAETEHYTKPVPNKWLPGDTIDRCSGSVLARKMPKDLVGIVDYLNRTGYGFTPRGIPLYMFHPLDPAYPPMLVSSKSKYDNNMIVTVNMEHWEGKWPRAGIQRVLGVAGDRSIEKTALFLRAGAEQCADTATEPTADTSIHKRILWDTVFHIDPEGCEDVDDIICWQINKDSALFAIAIADVSAWVPQDSPFDREAANRGQTLYVDGKVNTPMLPTSISSGAASLRSDGVERPVLALVYSFIGGVLNHVSWQPLLVAVQKTYSYESVYSEPEVCARLTLFLESLLGRPVGNDSHTWIEAAMVEYNRRAAELLKGHSYALLRSHAGRSHSKYVELAEKTGVAELAWLGSAAGKYVRADASVAAHAGLGLDTYTHASSPLRRYADLVNQRALKHILFGCAEPKAPIAETLNARGEAAKSLERDLWFLTNLSTTSITSVEGYVLEFKESRNTWLVYVPAWRRKVRAKVGDGLWLPTIGQKFCVRAFVDLRRCVWSERLVCAIGSAT